MVTPLPQLDPLSRHKGHEPQVAVRDAVLAIVSTATSLDAILQSALAEVCAGLACEVGAIHLLSGDSRTLDLAAHVGFDAEARAALGVLPASEWPLAAAAQGGDLLALHDFAAHPGAPAWVRSLALGDWIGAPLRSPVSVLGAIWAGSRTRRLSVEQDGALLRAVGQQLGLAVDCLRTHLEIERTLSERNARWSALYDTGMALAREFDGVRLLDEIVRRGIALLHGRGGGLTLLDEAGSSLEIVVAYRDGQPVPVLVGRRYPPSAGVSGQVLHTLQPAVIDDYTRWERRDEAVSREGYEAIAAVPLSSAGRAIGVLMVTDTSSRRFTEDEVQILSLLAQQASAALEIQASLGRATELALHEERARLARDLHDGLAQDLASLLLRADLCQTLAGGGNAALRANLEAISTGLQRCIRDARATIFALRQPDSGTCSLEGNLAAQASQFESQTHIPVRYTIAGEACQPLPKTHEIALLRVAQEALSNVRKHAQATQTVMGLTWHAGGSVSLKITDDGVGFDQAAVPGVNGAGQHFGLVSMRERIEELGGALTLQSSPGGGTCLEVRLSTPAGG